MKTKSFQEYLQKRLDKKEIDEIKKQAALEVKILKYTQQCLLFNNIGYITAKKFLYEQETNHNN